MGFSRIEDALETIANGGMVIVVDDPDRENEGDLIMAASAATPEAMAFIIRYTSGVVCVALPGERLDVLRLPLMVSDGNDAMRTAFTVSVDYRHGTTTGISASDRAATLRALVDSASTADDFLRPGHVFPLRGMKNGVLRRRGHTEAAIDLTRLANLREGGVLCEITNDDGTMARGADLERFAERHGLTMITIADLVAYRKRTEMLVRRISEARLPTRFGHFTAIGYEDLIDGHQHLALTLGDLEAGENVLTRVHSECLTGDLFGSLRCDCGRQLDAALANVAREGAGTVIYLRGHEGRGIGLGHKLSAYALQDRGHDTVQANLALGFASDARDYTVGAHILKDLGIRSIRLMSNNPDKIIRLEEHGLSISARVPLLSEPNAENIAYLRTKQSKMGHLLELPRDLMNAG